MTYGDPRVQGKPKALSPVFEATPIGKPQWNPRPAATAIASGIPRQNIATAPATIPLIPWILAIYPRSGKLKPNRYPRSQTLPNSTMTTLNSFPSRKRMMTSSFHSWYRDTSIQLLRTFRNRSSFQTKGSFWFLCWDLLNVSNSTWYSCTKLSLAIAMDQARLGEPCH
jgi:hypothetical protein